MSRGPGTPSRDLTKVVLCSSRIISMQSSTHSSQMNTVGPAISFLTSCWLLPQKEQYSVFLESPPLDLVIAALSPAERARSGRNRYAHAGTRARKPPSPALQVYVLRFDQQLVKSSTPRGEATQAHLTPGPSRPPLSAAPR